MCVCVYIYVYIAVCDIVNCLALYFLRHTNELRNYSLYNTQQRKFLFAALRRFVLGAARLVVVRLVGCLRRNGLAGC